MYVHGGGNLQAKTELLNRDFLAKLCPSKSYSGHDLSHFGLLSSGSKMQNIYWQKNVLLYIRMIFFTQVFSSKFQCRK